MLRANSRNTENTKSYRACSKICGSDTNIFYTMSVERGGVVGRCVTLNLEEYCLAAAAGGY